jgi:hypothetical protein
MHSSDWHTKRKETRQCSGGTKAAMHQPHETCSTLPSDEDPLFNGALRLSRNRAELNKRILELPLNLSLRPISVAIKLPHRQCTNLFSI